MALIFAALYTFGIPALFFFILWLNRDSLHNSPDRTAQIKDLKAI